MSSGEGRARDGAAEQERLRQFLQWREATGRAPHPWRVTRGHVGWAGAAVLLIGIAVIFSVATSDLRRAPSGADRPIPAAPGPRRPVARQSVVEPPRQWREDTTTVQFPLELPPRPAKPLATPAMAQAQEAPERPGHQEEPPAAPLDDGSYD